MDTVLIGGLVVLLFAGAVWLVHFKVDASDLSPTVKRVVNYSLVILVLAAAVAAIDWHNDVWLAR